MTAEAPAGHYVLDTSCLVKLFVNEQGDATARVHRLVGKLAEGIKLWVSPASLVETLGVFKRTLKTDPEAYVRRVALLDDYARRQVFHLIEAPLSQKALIDALDDVRRAKIDVLDALHFHLMVSKPFSGVDVPSIAILTTTDDTLKRFAKDRGFFVWDPGKTEEPELY